MGGKLTVAEIASALDGEEKACSPDAECSHARIDNRRAVGRDGARD
jgi:hypothetical protein